LASGVGCGGGGGAGERYKKLFFEKKTVLDSDKKQSPSKRERATE
jgi:hypothetical protein